VDLLPELAVMMDRLCFALTALPTDRSGATALEYGLIAAFISIAVVGWATFMGTTISGFFMDVANGM
jgi:Flp pilus assembly pilin Flp